ncbi:MAG: DUF4349 domain-containing protein [Erysipelotrichaceae bacterium]|nr:DUF4349 domain-containing protein [Erysipelotrichaceae bacterium]
MKNIRKIIVIIMVLLLCGCAGGKMAEDRKTTGLYEDGYAYNSDIVNDSGTGFKPGSSADTQAPDVTATGTESLPSKIIVKAGLEMESSDLNKTVEQINAAIAKVGGYVQSSKVYANDYSYYHSRSAHIVVRVPADRYEEFMAATEEYGNIISVNTSADDITTAYYDLAARLESLKTQRERVMEFYKQAKNIEELIMIEQRLTEIDSEIAAKEITMKNYDLLTAYSTVTFDITEVSKFTETEDTFFTRLKNTVVDSFTGFMYFLEEALFFVINSFWYVLLLIGVIFVVSWLNRKFHFLKKPVIRRRKNGGEDEEHLS